MRLATNRRASGQALIEFALTIGLVVILSFGAWLFWGYFQRTSTYLDTSQSLSEWMSRAHDGNGDVRYTSSMRDTIRGQINDSTLGNADEAYLFILAVNESDGKVLLQCGTPAPSSVGSNPSPPSDTGWDSCVSAFDDYVAANVAANLAGNLAAHPAGLPRGTRLEVDIWSFDELSFPLIPLDVWLAPGGHSVSFVLG